MMKGLQKNVSIICLSRELEATILEFMMECHTGHSFEEETLSLKDPLFEEETSSQKLGRHALHRVRSV